jgi:3-hydroxyacyl-[acyl-carrier-protein] dehydratase
MTAPTDLLQLAMRSLPHGPEFRFVDHLISLEPGKTGVGEYLVRGDEYYLRGHLPGEPIFPGVLLVEAGAQVAGMVAQEDPANPSLPRLKLTALRAVKIFGSAKPGEKLRIEATITGRLGLMVQATASAYVGDIKVMSAELALSGTANDSLGTKTAGAAR